MPQKKGEMAMVDDIYKAFVDAINNVFKLVLNISVFPFIRLRNLHAMTRLILQLGLLENSREKFFTDSRLLHLLVW